MKSFLRYFYYTVKNLFGDAMTLFWLFLFPLLLLSTFNMAFGKLMDENYEDEILVGVSENSPFEQIFDEVDQFTLRTMNPEEGKDALVAEELAAYIDGETLYLYKNGLHQSIVKSAADVYEQIKSLELPPENYDFSREYLENKKEKSQPIAIAFYALFSMVTLYGVFSGYDFAENIRPFGETQAVRVHVSPVRKSKLIFQYFIVTAVVNLGVLFGLMMFGEKILGLNLFMWKAENLLVILPASALGIALGLFLASALSGNPNLVTGVGLSILMTFSFLSGMMQPDMLVTVRKAAPWLQNINPVAILTVNYFRVNSLGLMPKMADVATLAIETALFLVGSVLMLRRNPDGRA